MIGSWDFLQNPHLALNSSLYWSLLCLLLLVGCGVGFSIVKELRRRRGLNAFWNPTEKLIAATGNAIGKVMFVILGVLIGAGIRDHQLASHQVTYTDVDVVQKVTDVRYFVQPARMKLMDITLCTGRVDWRAGDLLEDWTFEQMQGCKRIIAYHKKPQGEIHVSLR